MKKALIIGCVGCGSVALLAAIAVVAWLVYVAEDPAGVAVEVDCPLDVTVGEEFDVVVRVTNEGDAPFVVDDIDFTSGYIDGFSVIAVEPEPESKEEILFLYSMTFGREIAAGATDEFRITLRGELAGIHRGDLDVYRGSRSVTTLVQTVVHEPEGGEGAVTSAEADAVEAPEGVTGD